MTHDATKMARFLGSLKIPEGPAAGRPLKLARFQRDFLKAALHRNTNVACLSVGRGNGKSALSAGVALGSLLGIADDQPRRQILIGARTRDQGRVVWEYCRGLAGSLPEDVQKRLQFRRSPVLSVELDGEHELRVLAADGKSALGTSPTLVICDERGHWALDKGDALEHALLTGLGKRGGKALLISTSASDDAHPFSKWLDEPPAGTFVAEYRPPPSLPPDDLESLLHANPGARAGIGASEKWLVEQAQRAISRGGSALTSFRLYHRNERVASNDRDVLLSVDEWLACETDSPPPREGGVVIGIDLGGSASMSAAAYYWPQTGRLEVVATFPSVPSLLNRGQRDSVGDRYVQMQTRGELNTMGDATVPVAPWLVGVMRRVEGEHVLALVMDRYKQAELGEAIARAGTRAPLIWRGQGFRDGGEDCERFRRGAYDAIVKSFPTLLLKSALSDAIVVKDDAGNLKLSKSRSNARIDAVSATVLAVAEGARITGRQGLQRSGRIVWA